MLTREQIKNCIKYTNYGWDVPEDQVNFVLDATSKLVNYYRKDLDNKQFNKVLLDLDERNYDEDIIGGNRAVDKINQTIISIVVSLLLDMGLKFNGDTFIPQGAFFYNDKAPKAVTLPSDYITGYITLQPFSYSSVKTVIVNTDYSRLSPAIFEDSNVEVIVFNYYLDVNSVNFNNLMNIFEKHSCNIKKIQCTKGISEDAKYDLEAQVEEIIL